MPTFLHLHIFQAISVALLDAMETLGFLDRVLWVILRRKLLTWLICCHAWSVQALEVDLILRPVRLFGAGSHRVRRVCALIGLYLTVETPGEARHLVVARTRYIMIHRDGLSRV